MAKNKDDELVLVVESEIIFEKGIWQGLKTDNLDYYVELIKNNCQFKRRGDVETDPSFQQIIPYIVFNYKDVDAFTNKAKEKFESKKKEKKSKQTKKEKVKQEAEKKTENKKSENAKVETKENSNESKK